MMRILKFSLAAGLFAVFFLTTGCDKCDSTETITISSEEQAVTLRYMTPQGDNYISDGIYNPNNVKVWRSTEGRNGQYSKIEEDLSDGVFGPFHYSTKPINISKGVPYDYWYIIEKDTFGFDTLNVEFLVSVDECKETWGLLNYYLDPLANPEPLPESGNPVAEIVVVE